MINRAIKNAFVFKKSCESICAVIGEDLPLQRLTKLSIINAHKVIRSQHPKPMIDTLRTSNFPRACHDQTSNLEARTLRRKHTLLYRLPLMYNNIPPELKMLNHKLFKKKIRINEIPDVPIT